MLPNGYRAYSESVFDRLRFIDTAANSTSRSRGISGPAGGVGSGLVRVGEGQDPGALLAARLATVDGVVETLIELRDHLPHAGLR